MTKSEAVLEQIRTLAAGLSPEEQLSAIRTIAEVEPAPTDEEDELIKHLMAEQEAWFARPFAERQQYAGEYVAIQDGKVVDHDEDKRELYLRTRKLSARKPVLLVHADWDTLPEYTFRSPRLVR
ncbi:MAG: hypothetical protein DCC55_16070 [Chloroflexi bacterium]|nr:MAG: hypothetical protein DCC55_16070 [Chloroflexota bacterium]